MNSDNIISAATYFLKPNCWLLYDDGLIIYPCFNFHWHTCSKIESP